MRRIGDYLAPPVVELIQALQVPVDSGKNMFYQARWKLKYWFPIGVVIVGSGSRCIAGVTADVRVCVGHGAAIVVGEHVGEITVP